MKRELTCRPSKGTLSVSQVQEVLLAVCRSMPRLACSLTHQQCRSMSHVSCLQAERLQEGHNY